MVTHAINDFCVVELSNFYLDILKDRLYCESRNGLKRRSAQTALYLIVDALARMYAPILAFTCDEIWQAMPHKAEDDTRNIILNEMVKPYEAYSLDEEAMAKWDALIALRSDVNGVLEAARGEKRIGKALEACVSLYLLDDEATALWEKVKDMNLPELFIVSDVVLGSDLPDEQNICGKGTNYTGINIEDLISIGTIGLIKAINTFNPEKNIKLATYASRCIENEILMYIRKTAKEKAEVSLDEPINLDGDGNELLLGDILGTEEDVVFRPLEEAVDLAVLRQSLRQLPQRERELINMRYGLEGCRELTQKEAARKMGISQSYISRLEKRIIQRLKKEFIRMTSCA